MLVLPVACPNRSFGMERTGVAPHAFAAKPAARPSPPNPTHGASPRKRRNASNRRFKSALPSPPSLECSMSARQPFTRYSKKTSQLPPLEQTLVLPERDAVEIDELCISKKRNLWLWTAVSRKTGQFLATALGDRSQVTLARLWDKMPASYRRRPVYTDEYRVYFAFFAPWQHHPSPKGSGGTSVVEGTNTSLRHRSGVLVRRTCSRSRETTMLDQRIMPVLHAHNQAAKKRGNRRGLATQSNG